MKEINLSHLETALVLGDAICCELDVPCGDRGKVIHKVYQKLLELQPQTEGSDKPEQEAEHTQ